MAKTDNSERLADIQQQIKSLGYIHTFFTRKEVKYLPEIMDEDEVIKGMASGLEGVTTWLIVCTNRRILFLDKGMIFGLKQKEIPLDSISAVTHKTGIIFGAVEITAAGLSGMYIGQIEKKSVAKFAKSVLAARRELLGK